MNSWTPNVTTTWTNAEPQSALVRVQRNEGRFLVSDMLGLRHGVGETVEAALVDWARGVEEFVAWAEGQRLGKSLAVEVATYRRFFAASSEGTPSEKETQT